MLLAEWWWVAPAGAGAGTLGVLGARRLGPAGRRLELEGARHAVRDAQRALARSRAQLGIERAELARSRAERAPSEATAEAKRRVRLAERAVKAAAAALAARRASVAAARAAVPPMRAPAEAMPLARLRAEHDALTARWMAYETDPAMLLEAPGMRDASSPELREFLRAQREALELRPSSADARMTPGEFSAYRDAVAAATRAFDSAERAARGTGSSRAGGPEWSELATGLLDGAQLAIARSLEAWQRAERARRERGA